VSNYILGLFEHVDVLIEAAGNVKKSGCEITILSPIQLSHDLEQAFGHKKNLVKYFTGFGAIAGLLFGTAFALGTAFLYALPRGGKPIFPFTPTLLIAFETTILFGVLMTLTGFMFFLWWFLFRKKGFHQNINIAVDAFGLLVSEIREDKLNEVKSILKEHGAYDIQQIKE